MDYVDMFHPSYSNDNYDNGTGKVGEQLESFKRIDSGHCRVTKVMTRSDGRVKQKKIDIYASGSIGSRIRDAESGQYYQHIVGSSDEDLYFKIAYSTGECNNGYCSNTLFYLSPQHCINHLSADIDQETIGLWEEKKNRRLRHIEKSEKGKRSNNN